MLVTSLECSEMVTSDLPGSQDLTLLALSWLKGLIWGQASTGGGVHECVYKVCIHMSVLSYSGGIWGEGILSSKVYMFWKYWIRLNYTGFFTEGLLSVFTCQHAL